MFAGLFLLFMIVGVESNPYCLAFCEQKGYGQLTEETVLVVRHSVTDTDVAIIFRPRGPVSSLEYGPRFSTLGGARISIAALDSLVYQYDQWRRRQGLEPLRR